MSKNHNHTHINKQHPLKKQGSLYSTNILLNRKRFMSLKSIPPNAEIPESDFSVIRTLEKSLEKDNQKESPLPPQPTTVLPGFEQPVVQCKLWKYFLEQSQIDESIPMTMSGNASPRAKVERSLMNGWIKCMDAIKKEVDKKLHLSRQAHQQSKMLIAERYKQIHQLFQELKQERRMPMLRVSNNRNPMNLPPPQSSQKSAVLKQTIASIRSQIDEMEHSTRMHEMEMDKVKREWKAVLVNLLKGGYYRQDGVRWMLREMAIIGYIPKQADFNQSLDSASVKCLLQQYYNIQNEQNNKNNNINANGNTQVSLPQLKSNASTGMSTSLLKHSNLRHLYQNTQEYMIDWIKRGGWKSMHKKQKEQQVFRPVVDWRDSERKRMQWAYTDDQTKRKVKSIMFGPKLSLQV